MTSPASIKCSAHLGPTLRHSAEGTSPRAPIRGRNPVPGPRHGRDLRKTPISVIPNAAERSEESKVLVLQAKPCSCQSPLTTARHPRFLATLGMTDCSAGNARVSKPVRVVPLADTQRLPTISPFCHIRTHELQYPCRRNGFGPARAAPRIHCELNSKQRQENFGHTKFLKLSHDRIVRRMHVPQTASNAPCGWAKEERDKSRSGEKGKIEPCLKLSHRLDLSHCHGGSRPVRPIRARAMCRVCPFFAACAR